MMTPRAYLFCPGIRSKTSDNHNWAPVSASRVNLETAAKGDEFRYFEFGYRSEREQDERAEEFFRFTLRYMAVGFEVVGVFHSNGGDIAERVVRKLVEYRRSLEPVRRRWHCFAGYHLIAAAAERDFILNGYNDALGSGAIEEMDVYWSENDGALNRAAPVTQFFGKLFGKGYKRLGGLGPVNISEPVDRVRVHQYGCGHTEYFENPLYNQVFKNITRLERL